MAEDNRRFKSTAELAFVNFSGEIQSLPEDRYGTVSGEQRRRINQGIDECMRGAIADTRRPNPVSALGPSPTARPLDAAPVRSGPQGNGWRDSGPLRPVTTPLAEAVIEAMTHQALPHSPGNAAFRGPKPKEK